MRNLILATLGFLGVMFLLRFFDASKALSYTVIIACVVLLVSISLLWSWWQEKSYRKKYQELTDRWSVTLGEPLTIDLQKQSVNGVCLNSPLAEAVHFGRPDTIESVRPPDLLSILFSSHGMILAYEEEKLDGIELYFQPDSVLENNIEFEKIEFREVSLQRPEAPAIQLSRQTCAEDVISYLGAPADDQSDECERLVSYQEDDVILCFEFEDDGTLRTFFYSRNLP